MTAYERHPPHPTGGTLETIAGPMFSGKTEELLRRMRRAVLAKQHVMLFKPIQDDRHNTTDVVSHDARRQEARAVPSAKALEAAVQASEQRPNLVGIDEVQFFELAIVDVCNRLADSGIRVMVAGLDLDYLGRPFGPMPLLLAHSEYVTKLHAICSRTGGPAHFSHRIEGGENDVQIGGAESYEALARAPYNEAVVRDHHRDAAPAS
ncbi:MAG: thymidine kinase [Crocinitomicaceae bacterium TMED114]|nr:MAG: thymidine kinase [Crocinitomicaceae bacterium TMED114]